jgi:hypothetical protein
MFFIPIGELKDKRGVNMYTKIYIIGFMLLMLFGNLEKVYAIDRVVIRSITVDDPDKWDENIYLIADKDGMDYKNFTVQVGDFGRGLYNFPNWINYSYEPKLFKEDLNDDKLEDIIVVLVTGAGSGVSEKGIHVLHQGSPGFYHFQEVPVEPIDKAVKRLAKMEKQGEIVTITTGKKKYKNDIAKFNYDNPGEPFANTSNFDYYIKNNHLFGSIGVVLSGSGSAYRYIGSFDIEYFWDGKIHKAKSIVFNPIKPEK